MEKVILEEINSMKYLLGYKRGVVISEQSSGTNQADDNEINPKVVDKAEQPAQPSGAYQADDSEIDPNLVAKTEQPAATTQSDVTTQSATTASPIKMGVVNPRIKYLQQLLNYKFQSGLVDDGKYGPLTAQAILTNIDAIKNLTPQQ
jgi:hypothetical protein